METKKIMEEPAYSIDQQVKYLFRGTALNDETRERMEGELRERLQQGRPLRVKLGLDPSKPFLHIGHLAPLLALKRFANMGHRTYLLLGGFTAMIGDPAGRKRRTPPLSETDVANNLAIYAQEIFRVLDPEKTTVVNNAVWFSNFRLIDFFLEAAKVTLAKILEHGDFKDRFDARREIGLQELLYPVAQAIDSMVLCAAATGQENDPQAYVDALRDKNAFCDVEVGGKDQLFNFTLTRSLMDARGLPSEIFVVTPLITGRDRQKMGKSDDRGNVVRLNDEPSDIYNNIMAMDDEVILPYLASITTISDDELEIIQRSMLSGKLAKVEAKQRLACEVVTLIHGREKAHQAQDEFDARRYGRVSPERDFVVAAETLQTDILISDLVYAAGLANSKSDAWRLVEQGGIHLDGRRIASGEKIVVKDGMVLQRGQGRDAAAVRLRVN